MDANSKEILEEKIKLKEKIANFRFALLHNFMKFEGEAWIMPSSM